MPAVTDDIKVAFWNLQNLFDTDVSRLAADLEYTPAFGWDRRAYENKLRNLAEVIRLMFDGQGPDILGVCEIENRDVADDLIGRLGRCDYALAHVDSPDIRGIDTSLIYSTEIFELASEPREHMIHLRYPTRDIFQVHLRVRATGAELTILVNHWPSRSRGTLETESFRMAVGGHCARIVDDILKLERMRYVALRDGDEALELINRRWDRNILLMGDFNDEPYSRSVMAMLNAGFSTDQLEEPLRTHRDRLPSFRAYAARQAALMNPMWSLMREPDQGTHYYAGAGIHTLTMLDQMLMSRGLHFGRSGLQTVSRESGVPWVKIFRPECMTTRKGRPRPFDRKTRDGYSDHFPVLTRLTTVQSVALADAA